MTAAAQLLSLAPLPALMLAALNDMAARRVPDWAPALIAACGLAVPAVRLSPSGEAKILARLRRVCRIEGWRIRHRESLSHACTVAAGCMFTLAGV